MNFWQKLKEEKNNEPIVVLAPMADVTDAAFRKVICENGKPDVIWTEFVSADGLVLAPDDNPDDNGMTSQDKLRADLIFDESEHLIVAQIFGSRPENIKKVSKEIYEMGFDGVDINMGCPDRSIEKQKCGSAMIKDPKNAQRIVRACKEGVGYVKDVNYYLYRLGFRFLERKLKTNIPVTVKTRLGYNKDELETWLPALLKVNPAVVTIHARTRKEMSKVPARWERIKRAVEIRDELGSDTLIFGNGDVLTPVEAQFKYEETGCDGVMIGRGIFGNPWLFGEKDKMEVSVKERLEVMLRHTKLFEELLPHKNFAIMKKHYKSYTEGMDNVKELRMNLMDCNDSGEVQKVIDNYLAEV